MPTFFSWPGYQKHLVKMFLSQILSAQLDIEDSLLQLLHIWMGAWHYRHSATCATLVLLAATQKQKFQVYDLKQVLQIASTAGFLIPNYSSWLFATLSY